MNYPRIVYVALICFDKLDELNGLREFGCSMSFSVPGGPSERAASVFAAKCEPWLQETLAGFGQGIRRPDADRIIIWCNYVPAGVVSSRQHAFTVEQITQACHANPRTACAVVLFPNRAGDLRSSPTKPLGYQVCFCIPHRMNLLARKGRWRV